MRLVWDLETAEPKEEDESWENYKGHAGLGVAVSYNEDRDEWKVYNGMDLVELVEDLEAASEVVSFNGVRFDHQVVDAAIGRRVVIEREVDLWLAIKAALGPEMWPKGSWTLNAVCERTLGRGKTSDGVLAPTKLAKGEWGTVTTYCINDVRLTRDLWRFIREFGYVVDPTGKQLRVGAPCD